MENRGGAMSGVDQVEMCVEETQATGQEEAYKDRATLRSAAL